MLPIVARVRIIWDSADCTRGEPNRVATFRRGVPVQESFTWNRSISLPGCVASPVRAFKLAR